MADANSAVEHVGLTYEAWKHYRVYMLISIANGEIALAPLG